MGPPFQRRPCLCQIMTTWHASIRPPTWPTPPEGWEPPEGWHPDPSWPPAPEGWELWVDDESDDPSTTTSQLQSDSTAPLPARTGRRPIWQRTGVIVSALVGGFSFWSPAGPPQQQLQLERHPRRQVQPRAQRSRRAPPLHRRQPQPQHRASRQPPRRRRRRRHVPHQLPHRNKNNPRKCLNNSRRIRHQHRYNNNLLPITRTAPRCALQEQPPSTEDSRATAQTSIRMATAWPVNSPVIQ